MIINFEGKKPIVDRLTKAGNLGEQNVDTLEFVLSRTYNSIDLSTYTPSIEWARVAGGADFATGVTTTFDTDYITIKWVLDASFLDTAGKAMCKVVLTNALDGSVWISDVVNLYIDKGLDITEEIIKSYPENYRELWDNVLFIRGELATGVLKGDTGETGPQGIQGIQGIQGLIGEAFVYTDFTAEQLALLNKIYNVDVSTLTPEEIASLSTKIYVDVSTLTPEELTLLKGDQGIQGFTGLTGDTGLTGPQGIQGIQGIQGFTGDQGIRGIQGVTGSDGLEAYNHIAYADDDIGTGFSQLPAGKAYVGFYADHTLADSLVLTDYSWSLILGPQGTQGIQGVIGPDGLQGIQGITGADGLSYNITISSAVPTGGVAGDIWFIYTV